MATRPRILIIDDRQENLYITKETIKALMPECDVLTAMGPHEGLKMATNNIAVVVCDVQMPRMSGIELCRSMKETPELKHIPVFLITSHRTIPQLKVEGLEAGALDFISRPLDSQELIAKIRVGLNIRKNEDGLRKERNELANMMQKSGKRLMIAEHRYKSLFDSASDSIFILSLDGEVLEANQEAHALLGYQAEALIGLNLDALVKDGKWPVMLASVPRTGISQTITHFLNIDKDIVPVEVRCRQVDLGMFKGILAIARDLSDQKRIERRMVELAKMESLGQLAAGVTHEINTPVQFVMHNMSFLQHSFESLAQLLKEYQHLEKEAKENADYEEILGAIRKRADAVDSDFLLSEVPVTLDDCIEGLLRITRIVQSIKTYAHTSNNQKRRVDLKALIQNVVIVTTNEWKYHSKVTMDMDEDLPEVNCDPDLINQTLVNLIINAANSNSEKVESRRGEKAHIIIQCRREGEEIVISVKDEGMGIPAEIQDRIFDLFFTTKKAGVGSGQGLAIVRKIIEEIHNGSVGFETTVGEGSLFTIRLPM